MPVNLPDDTTAEVTLIGTGGGYGESSVLHVGEGHWIVIDSCIDPTSGECLPLKYLESIGIAIETDVKMILCTHWHDDHIRGLSTLFEKAKNAKLAFASALDRQKFLQLVTLDAEKLKKEASNSSTYEFSRCLEFAKQRNVPAMLLVQDKLIYKNQPPVGLGSELYALSPSDYTLGKFNDEISTLITEFGKQNRKIIASSPNAKSVATFIKLGYHRVLLGADLENGADPLEGWTNILDNCLCLDQKATLFKIPHHGSDTGYHKDVWSTLLTQSPVAKLTPWNKKDKLPSVEMLETFCGHTDQLFITSPVVSLKPKKRTKSIEKFINSLKCQLTEIKFNQGIIRCRIDMQDQTAAWEVLLIDHALKVTMPTP